MIKETKVISWEEFISEGVKLPKEPQKVISWEEFELREKREERSPEETERLGLPILRAAPPKEEIRDTWLKRIARIILPRSLEVRLGITEPNQWDLMMQREDARISYLREQQFRRLYEKEIIKNPEIPEDYKEPKGYWGQFLEAIKAGYIEQIKGGLGYTFESIGRIIGSPRLLEWGARVGDRATIELIKRPELLEPKDLKPFFKGGIVDRRWWGRRMGQVFPYIGSTIGLAILGGLIGGPKGAAAAGFSSVFALEKGNSYKRYLKEGVPPDKADLYSNIYGAIATIIENIFGLSPVKIGTHFALRGVERTVYEGFKPFLFKEIPRIATKTLKTATVEGGEEVAQSIAEDLVLKFYKKEVSLLSKDLAEEFASGFAGAIPFGVVNIRIPEIRKINPEEIRTIEKNIKKTDELLQKIDIKPGKLKEVKFPENKYKHEILKEINKLEELPKIDPSAFEFVPALLDYNNPYTRVMTRVWNRILRIWNTKAPLILKEAQTQEISQLIRERQRVYDGLVKKYFDDVIKPLIKLSPEEKTKIGKMIFKRIDIPKDFRPIIKDIDVKIGHLGQTIINLDKEMIGKGYLKPEMSLLSEKTWLTHLGEYARTLYIRPPKVPGEKPRIIPRSLLTKEGIIDRSAFKRKLTDEEWGANALLFEGKSLVEIKEYTLEELREIGREAKERFGWVFQADYILARTFKDLAKALATRQFQKAIVENPRVFTYNAKTAKELGFVAVKDLLPKGVEKDIRLGPLNYGYIHPGLREEIRTVVFDKAIDRITEIFQEPLSWWKAFKVPGNPPTVIRNWLCGAFLQTDMAGFPVWTPKNVARYIRAVKSYLTKDDFYKKLRDQGQYGADYFTVEIETDEMARIIAKVEKSNNPYQTYSEGLLKALGTKLTDLKQVFSYYGHIDHIQRTYLALCLLETGILVNGKRVPATIPQAVHFANKWQLDYRFGPQFMLWARQGLPGWLMPFISFYTLITPRIVEVLVTRPWVLLKYPILLGVFNAISSTLLGVEEDEIEKTKPDWLKDRNYVVILPFRDNDGNFIFLDVGYVFPFGGPESLFLDWNAIWMMATNPGMMNIVISILNNYDNFTDRKIYNETDPPEEKYKKIAEYVARNFGPGLVTHALNIYRAAKGEIAGFPIRKERDLAKTVARTLGVSLYSGGFNEIFWKIRNLQREIDEIEWSMRLIMTNPNISLEEKERKIFEYQDELRRRIEKIQEIAKVFPLIPPAPPKKEKPSKVISWEEFVREEKAKLPKE